ncbi:MAG: GxxExxY protein [Candidatus Omnitrophica bacterium]|nr:GxxExxY protein [Candidatus Omnitrophota bacterium]
MGKHKFLYEELTNKIISLAIQVHRKLGPGFVEKIYEKALAYEFQKDGLAFIRQKVIRVKYDAIYLGDQRIDFLVDDKVIVDLKAVIDILDFYLAQMISYLRTMNKRVGLLLNFARPTLQIKRVVN